MAVLLVLKALCLFLLSGVFTTSLGMKEGSCAVRRTRKGDRIRPYVQTQDLCADNNFCSNYNAVPVAGCICACAPTNSTIRENMGTCVPNTAIRNGCASYVYSAGETRSSSLRLFINTSFASLKIGSPNYRDCSIFEQSSYYFTKAGSWTSLGGDQAGFPFEIQKRKERRKTVQVLKWKGQPNSSLFGHLIKLDVSCKVNKKKVQRGCLIFKVQGGIQVPCIIPTTQKPPVIPSQSPTGQKGPTRPSTSASNPNGAGGTTKTTSPTRGPTSEARTVGASSTSVVPVDQTNPPALRHTTTQLPVNVIIAVAIAVTAVAVACIVGFVVLIFRRKKKRRNGNRTGNPTYQSADDSTLPLHQLTDEPVYATVSSPTHAPVYQPLTLERTSKDYQLLVKQPLEDSSGYLEPVENNTKHVDPREYDYACPETVIEGDTMSDSARYASADDIGYMIDDQPSSLDPTSPFYNVLDEGSPKSPSGVSGPDNTSSSSPQRKPVSPSEELQEYDPYSNQPSSPVTYLDLLPDCVA